jgi:hypothetical protein
MSNKSKKIAGAFESCLQMIEKENILLKDCLTMYPEFKQELTELYNLINTINELKDISPSEKFSENARERITHRLIDRPVTFFEHLRHTFKKNRNRCNRRFSMSQFLVTLILLLSIATGGVFAADASHPGDVLYGLDRALDQVKIMFILDPETIAAKRLEFATARLEEAENEIKNGNIDNAIIAFEAYDHEIDKYAQMLANEEGLVHEMLSAMIAEALNIHQEVLAKVLEKVPEQAKESIKNAMEASLPMIDDLPVGPPADIIPGPPMDIPPGPPIDIPPGPPMDDPPGPPENIPADPPVDVPPGPPVDVPPGPPVDIPPGPPVDVPPGPPVDVPPGPPENIPTDPPIDIPPGPPVDVPPRPPVETPENPGKGMP